LTLTIIGTIVSLLAGGFGVVNAAEPGASAAMAGAMPQITNILPAADTYLNGGSSANRNYGTDPLLQVRTWSGDANYTRESYMKFDLSSYTEEPGSVKLNVYAAVANSNGSPYSFQLYGVEDDSWDEYLTTWTYKPSAGHYLANVNVGLTWKWIQVDVTSFVKAQLASDRTASFGLTQQATAGALIYINSKESEANQPYLSLSDSRSDESAPAWPSGSSVQVTHMNDTGIDLSWSEANNTTGAVNYRVYQNGKLMAAVNGTSWHRSISDTDLDKAYTYKIEAGNDQNHWSNDGPYVSAAIPKTKLMQTKIGNVFMDNEPIRIQVATLLPSVTWSVYDMQGESISQGSSNMNEAGKVTVEVPFTRHGYFTFQASVAKEGTIPVELKTSFAVLSPFDVSSVEESPFGIATHLHRGQKNVVPLIQYAGAKTIRDGIEWNGIERTQGVYIFSPVPDDYMSMLKEAGLDMLFVSGFNNPFYDNNATPHTDAGREGFANYAEAYVAQYKDQLVAAEAYNEFNGGFGKRGNSPANSQPEYYYKLLKKTYETIKANHPEFPVIGIVASEDAVSWIEEVFKLGGLQYMDVVSLHPYRYPQSPEGLADSIDQIKALIRKYNHGELKPIWATEFGYPTFQSTRGVDEITQADYMVRYYVIALASGIEKTFWYDLVNDGVRDDYNEDNFGLLRNAQDEMGAFTPKPAYAAYAAMTRELTGAQFVQEEPLGGGMKSYLFDKDGSKIRAVWSLSPVSAAILTDHPVQITDMMGNAQTYSPYQGKVYVSLNGEPLYIKGDIQRIVGDSTFTVAGEAAVAGEQVLMNVQTDNAASQPLDFTLHVEGHAFDLKAAGGESRTVTIAVDGLKEPGTRLITGYVMSGNDRVGLLRHSEAVGAAEKIRIRPVIIGSDSANKTLKVLLSNLSKQNELPVDRIDWQLGTLSGQMPLNQIVPADSTSTFDIPLEGIQDGQSYSAAVTVGYGGNKTFSYAGNIEFNPVYPVTAEMDGVPDPLVTARQATIDLSKGGVKVTGYKGADDLSGNIWLHYDQEHFYLTAEIKDDIFAYPANGANIWNNDSIQFAISNGLPAEDVNYYEYGISQTQEGPQIYRWIAPAGVAGGLVTNGTLHVSRDDNQKATTYELALPWSELLPVQTDEGVISFSLLVNENDGGLRRGYIEWGGGIGDGKVPSKFRAMQWVQGTAPVITIDGVKDGERYTDAVTPVVEVRDTDNDQQDVEALLDGKPWTAGTVITEKGAHTFVVEAVDQVGNKASKTVHFSVYQSTDLQVQSAAGEYSDIITLQAALKDKNGGAIEGEQVVFQVNDVLVGTGQTDSQGVARIEYKVDVGAVEGSDTRNVPIKASYDGSDEYFYKGTEAIGPLKVSKERASITNVGAQSLNVHDTLTLSALVIQEQDGSYGSLENLPVQWTLSALNPDGIRSPAETTVISSVYLTDAAGSVSVSLSLSAGLYEVKTKLLDNPFYQMAEHVSHIAVHDSSAGALQINGSIELDGNQPFMGAKAKKAHLNVQWGYGEQQAGFRIHAEPQGLDMTITKVDWLVVADEGRAYLQGSGETNGETYTVRLMVQVQDPLTDRGPLLTLQIWKGHDTTVAPVFETIGKPLSGSAMLKK
jgi:hypothetical protein